MTADLAFVFVAEAGGLERQAALLLESIRNHAGPWRDAPVWIVQPRRGRAISQRALDLFHALGAVFVSADLNVRWSEFGYANKAYAAAFVESLVADRVGTLVFLGSDLLVLRPPEDLLLRDGESVAVRPVDGVLTLASPADGPPSDYWRLQYANAGADPGRVWDVATTVGGDRIRAYFQGDLLAVRPSRGIFRRWRDNLERLADDVRVQRLSPESLESCMLEQACFAATVLADVPRDEVRILDWRYNYPLPWHGSLPEARRVGALEEAVAVHYHRDFDDLAWMDRVPVHEPVRSWLLERLPLQGRG